MRRVIQLVAASAALTLVAACDGSPTRVPTDAVTPPIASITTAEWQRLAARRLFFAHQSVGGNIMDGVAQVLHDHPAIPLRPIEVADSTDLSGPGLYHKRVGVNGKPTTKVTEFESIATKAFADSQAQGVAMLKFCYADMKPATDPVALFEEYRRAVDSLRAARPGVVIVHVTMPLWVDTGIIDHYGTIILGKATPVRVLNAARQTYNDLLRQAYRGKEPFFDIAELEAMRADGTIEDVRYGGGRIQSLARESTTDGGHLTPAASRRIAEAFLVTLAKLP